MIEQHLPRQVLDEVNETAAIDMQQFYRVIDDYIESSRPHDYEIGPGCYGMKTVDRAGGRWRELLSVAPDCTGGTEDTIRRSKRAGKSVELR